MSNHWHRRIVPSGYVSAKLSLVGTCALLMNSSENDPESETYRAFKMLGEKRAKTLDDHSRLRELEWSLSLYLDPEIGPFIPGKNIKEMIRSAATKWKRGEDIKRSLIVIDERIPLQYDGPRDQKGLWDGGFRYVTMVANGGINKGRVMRCRPKFDNWKLDVEIAFDPEDIDFDFLQQVIERTQKYGLGDYRPTFGAFDASIQKIETNKAETNGDSIKVKNEADTVAHKAFVGRIKRTA